MDKEDKYFCFFIDNHPSEIPEHLNGCKILKGKFEKDKSKLTLKLEKEGQIKHLEITTNDKESWLWLFLTDKVRGG